MAESGIQEKAVVIGPDGVDAGMRVLQRCGNLAIVEAGPDDATAGADTVDAEVAGLGEESPEALALAAFRLRRSPEYIAAAAECPYDGMEWDAIPDPLMRPDPPPDVRRQMDLLELGLDPQNPGVLGTTSQRMTGKIKVAVVFVSGPGQDLTLTKDDKVKILAGLGGAHAWLALLSRAAKITWIVEHHHIDLNVVPNKDTPAAGRQAVWFDPTMQVLGFPGKSGAVDYAKKLQQSADWAYIAFFTKYPVSSPAYARIGGPYMVMKHQPSLPSEYVTRVVLHETGHIFQSLDDEYAASDCNCGGTFGYYDRPNGNCQPCAPNGGVPCVMRHNTKDVCSYTPWHWGLPWPTVAINNIAVTAYNAPAAVAFNGALMVLTLSSQTPENSLVQVTSSTDGLTWTPAATIAGSDPHPWTSPAACEFNGSLYAFWRTSSKSIHYSVSSDGTTWSTPAAINDVDSTYQPVTVCVFNQSLYVFWAANDASNSIYYSAWNGQGPAAWPAGQKINGSDSTSGQLAPCVFNGSLYLFWKSTNQWAQIFYSVLQGNGTWPAGKTINTPDNLNRAGTAPSALAYGSRLLLFFQGSGAIVYTTTSNNDGTTWPLAQPIGPPGSGGPVPVASVVFKGNPYLFWTTGDAANGISYSH